MRKRIVEGRSALKVAKWRPANLQRAAKTWRRPRHETGRINSPCFCPWITKVKA